MEEIKAILLGTNMYNDGYNQALEDMANRIKEYSGEHYIDCDGYYGRQTELVFRTEGFLDDVLSELKK